ncbi:penicillin binding protein [Thermomonospora umbrina]|uniref:Penicillin binding protein n=2 Tax=Thermomonospora umbrina TaxID=111806 RepID=A0A3D9SIV7_9ACTN|nr:penicillin binding protein [Thermomonospora umbrina]
MLAVVVLVAGAFAFLQSRRVKGSPEIVSRDYFAAWERGGLADMGRMVADAPDDFAERHRALSNGLTVYSIELTPGPLVREGSDRAHQEYEVVRNLGGRVTWRFRATIRYGLVDRRWRVLWTPATLHPELRGPATWKLTQTEGSPTGFADRDGRPLPDTGRLQGYVVALDERYDQGPKGDPGWAVDLIERGSRPRRLAVLGGAAAQFARSIRTTLDRRLQTAAEKAISGRDDAAIVAVRPSSGEILAVADALGGRNAFLGAYPPGSTFKVVTASALLSDGMSAGAGVDCPASVVTAQRTIRNSDGLALGGTSLRRAFAASCNTTFARLGVERLGDDALASAAETFGFGGPIAPGIAALRGSFPEPESGAELAEASIGQGRVQASPLVMAMVAAAVADGTWRSPRLVDADLIRDHGERPQRSREIPNASALRTLMRAVVTDGTAERAGLPDGTAGKTGTAEVGGGEAHAWFIGYHDDLAFAVLVAHGGAGSDVAAPLAADFLKGR